MNFRIKEKLMLWISGSKKNLFQRNKLAQRWSFHSIYEAWAAHEMRKEVVQLYIKNNEVIFSLAWNMIFSDNFKVLVLQFFEIKNMVFLSRKVDGNMIFTDYWKVLVLIFLGTGNMVFFWAKKLMERWYLLITEKFLFWTFRWWEIRPFFSQKVDGKMIFTWSFWAFHDIPGLGKYGFSCSLISFSSILFNLVFFFFCQIFVSIPWLFFYRFFVL